MQNTVTKTNSAEILEKAIQRYRERGIILPTFKQQRNPELIPDKIKVKLQNIGLWELNPLNLFRISWKNEPVEKGGLFGKVNYVELPKALTGVDAKIVLMIGKYFPTGAHKVGAAYGCLAPKVIQGEFDPTYHKAVWPSTGNYCRGGAFDSKIMGTESVAILPEEMSRERFEWLRDYIGSEVIATHGCESNVKEIYDKCWEIKRTRKDCMIFNQFEEFGNAAWHYNVTGPAIEEVFEMVKPKGSRFSAYISATGSAGTIAGGDYLRTKFPFIKVVASEALQCPTLLSNGFGGHRIEGIGDKHVPWIHNCKNTNVVTAIDDEDCMRVLRLFNEPEGHLRLKELGISDELISQLHLIGISGISNMLSAIKTAKFFEMGGQDVIVTIATDSADMYQSRIAELTQEKGKYSTFQAALDFEKCILGQETQNMKELGYHDQKAIHNLKYFTWVEQQGKTVEELNRLWNDTGFWPNMFNQVHEWDVLIEQFNERTGLLKKL
ncbi:MAG TPA: pyridoxal-5-phosphate-dependent protein subunit beta [Marinilabiliales bacterium]|jgi:cysteine synthase|nr:MAG: pyridoxal-5-phosphate-dependent protein subunit beta [Bacteroidetes bacterium GWA2_40_14]OFX65693.1 MAG: pyridoxal-5-phosphate-dependent protein subunit beta [Bacteroidetes bacterium GWC2_40_13]OFX75947.1 MAG: pyridoxal-5-phosphate-dependent protein subunit beta [Bacteroidetes bacterium GWD2_40_43]OFX94440.1 MAG: pyridoxal-5-phosphate-dependent protein subunit beta [Bacteroidetes bacterium GWE2_40_63]OFY18917.1 MAG: pyridoxal-5-phosphate-dependent protein subunit beta [Bacteroidetes bac